MTNSTRLFVDGPEQRDHEHVRARYEVMRTRILTSVLACVLAVACGKKDNSDVTDKASEDLRAAQSALKEKNKDVVETADDIERRKREVVKQQQELADKGTELAVQAQQLGSAQGTVVQADAAYRAAVTERLAKLDSGIATLATKVDAASKDAAAGLKTRRDRLAAMLEKMPPAADPGWAAYTKDVDTTFDATERDLRAAN
jgi:chromosome segregation ATPase